MSPLAYSLLKFAWNLMGMAAGAVTGAALLASGLLAWLGRGAGAAPLMGGLAGAVCAPLLWERCAWVRCPVCGSRMAKVHMGGRNFAFKCPACGRMDRAF